MFSHRVLISTFNNSLFIEMKKVYIGIEIKLLNKDPVYVYISKEPVIQHNQQFKEDLKRAKQIVQKLKKIAQKKSGKPFNFLIFFFILNHILLLKKPNYKHR